MYEYDPDNYTEPQSGLEPQSVESELTDWIDPSVIAECILREMADQEIPLTLEFAKKVWLDALDTLHEQLRASVDGVRDLIEC